MYFELSSQPQQQHCRISSVEKEGPPQERKEGASLKKTPSISNSVRTTSSKSCRCSTNTTNTPNGSHEHSKQWNPNGTPNANPNASQNVPTPEQQEEASCKLQE